MDGGTDRAGTSRQRHGWVDVGPEVVELLASVHRGRVYDLSSGWWPGMPLGAGHPAFTVVTYRTPFGERNQADLGFLHGNTVNFGFLSELLIFTAHSGTHVDALAHITCGQESTWYGGHSAKVDLGDFGPLRDDAWDLPPFVGRGVLLDVPATLGRAHLSAHERIGPEELERTSERQGTSLRPGDIVAIRTGTMQFWPDPVALERVDGAGLSLAGARWLVAHEPSVLAGDNVALEVSPSGIDGDPQPVHRYVIQEHGIPSMEWLDLEQLARDEVYEFLFIALPLTIAGATGSPIRPIALT